jgi:hypothetical protein
MTDFWFKNRLFARRETPNIRKETKLSIYILENFNFSARIVKKKKKFKQKRDKFIIIKIQ